MHCDVWRGFVDEVCHECWFWLLYSLAEIVIGPSMLVSLVSLQLDVKAGGFSISCGFSITPMCKSLAVVFKFR